MYLIPVGARAICFTDDSYFIGDEKGMIHEMDKTTHVARYTFQHSDFPIQHLTSSGSLLVATCSSHIKLWDPSYVAVNTSSEKQPEEDPKPLLVQKVSYPKIFHVESNSKWIAAQTDLSVISLLQISDLACLKRIATDYPLEAFALNTKKIYFVPNRDSVQYLDEKQTWLEARGFPKLQRPIHQLVVSEHYFCMRHHNQVQVFNPDRALEETLVLKKDEVLWALAGRTLAFGNTHSCTLRTFGPRAHETTRTFSAPISKVFLSESTWRVLLQDTPSKEDLASDPGCCIM